MFLSCHLRISEWIHILYLPECQEIPSSKQERYLKFKRLQQDSNTQPLSLSMNTQPSGQTDQMIELGCEHLSVRCIWLYVLLMSRTHFRVKPHSIFPWMSSNSLLFARNTRNIYSLSDWNGTRNYNHLVPKRTLKHLAKLTKWLSSVVSTYLYGPFDCIFLSCHIHIPEWIHTLHLPEGQETPCSKQARYLKCKWLQWDSKPQPLSS